MAVLSVGMDSLVRGLFTEFVEAGVLKGHDGVEGVTEGFILGMPVTEDPLWVSLAFACGVVVGVLCV